MICPLVFQPIYKPKIWGGRRLETVLGKDLPPGEPIGESWEAADLEQDQSVAAAGPMRGWTLGALVKEWGADLLGDAPLFEGRFPLLIKYLDAADRLSVQVHPDAAMARRLGGAVRVKNEAWYVIAAEPGGCIYRGLVEGVGRSAFADAVRDGRCEELLRRIEVRPGECYYLPSGVVHALGAGVLVAEVQTPSDITYRVFDWNRIDDSTGQPRDLHIEQALECIDFTGRDDPTLGEKRSHVASVWTTVTRLITCESFVIERVRMIEGFDNEIPYAQLVIWMMLEGRAEIQYGGSQVQPLGVGDTVVLPAGLSDARLKTHTACTWLEVTLPG